MKLDDKALTKQNIPNVADDKNLKIISHFLVGFFILYTSTTTKEKLWQLLLLSPAFHMHMLQLSS